ncbi:Inosine-uridine preferring nucleoside hydrolase [Helicosporidium sp. ATCC 50920]|nr:Inosine-uridine preferring nucleoside hydrolase [Helicosporidium sp. ATCC 50920]|eukprot:KDD76132.1 Inosine-uridine preferring nucleoside hydrolase [Helicosporidium sp. ATCC 50920]
MAASIAEGRGPIQLVATGSLTNVALLLSVYPSLIPHIEVVFMGGCLGVGNTGPAVEFNIQVDPESAAAVLASGVKVAMVPLEVTHTALVGAGQLSRVLSSAVSGPSRFRALIKDLLLFFADSYRDVFRFKDPPLHDPCAVAYVLAPQLFTTMDVEQFWDLMMAALDAADAVSPLNIA